MKELRLVMLCLAAAIAILLGYDFLLRAFKTAAPVPVVPAPAGPSVEPGPAAPPGEATARAAIGREIAGAPDYARFFDRLRQVFPSDYDTIMNELAANSSKEIDVDNLMDAAVASLRRAHGALEARAPEEALAHVFALQLDEVKALEARDTHLCAAFFVFGGNYAPGFTPFEAENRPLVANYAIAALDAMASGQTAGVDRGEPSQADFDMLDKALVDKGLTRPEIEALLDGKLADPPIADGPICKAGEAYLETLAGLPGDVRARLYSLSVKAAAKM